MASALRGVRRGAVLRPTVVAGINAVGSCRVITNTRLAAFSLPWRIKKGQPTLTVVVKARCRLVPDGAAELHETAALPSGDRLRGGAKTSLLYPSDFAVFKPRCDVVVSGHVYPPADNAPVRVAQLELGADPAGGIRRRVAVMGPRTWKQDVPTKPVRFERVPILHELCFGGGAIADNPIGTGLDGTAPPNFEDPQRLLKNQGDRPPPVGLGAIPQGWPVRWSKLGTYDKAWSRERFPYFAADFDWGFFQAAPAAQQVDAIEAGAPFALVGMHPEHDTLRGTLPAWRPCCFAVRSCERAQSHLSYQPVQLRLDTVVFRPDELEVDLVWRGVIEVADDDASDIIELFVDIADDMTTEQAAAAHGVQSQLALKLQLMADGANDAADPGIDPEVRAVLAAAGVAVPEPPRSASVASPVRSAAMAEREWPLADACPVRARATALLADADASVTGIDLSGGELSELDFSGRDLSRVNFIGARMVACNLDGAQLRQALLADVDLTDASLRGANLDQADLCRAVVERASFAAASMNHTDLRGARGEGADFERAKGKLAKLAKGTWHRARFVAAALPGLDLSDADVSDAVMDGANLEELRLYRVCGPRASFRNAKLNDARGDGAHLAGSNMDRAQADGAVFDGADLRGASLRGASLSGAGLVQADCSAAVLSGAGLRGARLRHAVLDGAGLTGADLMGASLERADLRRADLRGASLYGAELLGAQLDGAKLEGAVLANTKLEAR